MKNILNVKKVSLKPIFMSLAILFNVFAINGALAFASLNEGFQNGFYDGDKNNNNDNENGDKLNDNQPNLQLTGNSNGATNVDNSRIPDRLSFENLQDTSPEEFFFIRNSLKNLNNDSKNDNNCNDDNNCNNNSKDDSQQGD